MAAGCAAAPDVLKLRLASTITSGRGTWPCEAAATGHRLRPAASQVRTPAATGSVPGRRAGRWKASRPPSRREHEGTVTRRPHCSRDQRFAGSPAGRSRETDERPAAGDDRPPRRPGARPDDQVAGGADLPDHLVRVRRHPARRRPVRAGGAGEHLHAHHEPDLGRVRAADGRARGRHRRLRDRVRPGGRHLRGAQHHPGRRQHRLGLDAVRRHLQPLRAHAAAVRHRGALGLAGRAREARRARRRQDDARVRRDDRQPEAQRRRPRGVGRRRARAGPAADRRQHGADPHPLPRARPRRRRRRALGDEVHRRPRHLDRRRRRRLRQVRLGRPRRALPGPDEARPVVPRRRVVGRPRPGGVHRPRPHRAAPQHWAPRCRRSTPSSSCRGSRRCRCGWSATRRTRSRWRST